MTFHQKKRNLLKDKPLEKIQLSLIRKLLFRLTGDRSALYLNTAEDAIAYCKSTGFDHTTYFTPDQYQVYNLMRKYAVKGDDEACTLAALRSLLVGEKQNREINNRILADNWLGSISGRMVLSSVRENFRFLLGNINTFWADFVASLPSTLYSKGATTSQQFAEIEGRPWAKEIQEWHVSASLAKVLNETIPDWPSFFKGRIVVVEDSILTMVPKDGETHRTIQKQQSINMVFQKALGNHIRRQLFLKFGIDLNDASSNRLLASLGSLHKHIVTLDLQNASNTIAYMVIMRVLEWSGEWFRLFDASRSHKSTFKYGNFNTTFEYEMFSAMGNGYTFELESALFYFVCCAAAAPSRVRYISVFGDDITCHQDDYERVSTYLSQFGFTVNQKKTFSGTHPWRESCGKHYCNGIDYTPAFMRGPWTSITDVYAFVNSFGYGYIDSGLVSYVIDILEDEFAKYATKHKWLRLYFGPYQDWLFNDYQSWICTSDVAKYTTRYCPKHQRLQLKGHTIVPLTQVSGWKHLSLPERKVLDFKKSSRQKCREPGWVEQIKMLHYKLRLGATYDYLGCLSEPIVYRYNYRTKEKWFEPANWYE